MMLSRLLTFSFPFDLYPYLAAIVQEVTKVEVAPENVSPESTMVKSPGNRITPGPPQTWNYFDNWVSEFLHLILIKEKRIFTLYSPNLTANIYRMIFLRNLSFEKEMVREIKSLFFCCTSSESRKLKSVFFHSEDFNCEFVTLIHFA